MDAVIGNKYINVLNGLDIEVTKKLEGEFEVDEIIDTFKNFFFNKMFLDITSIKDYKNVANLQKLSMAINMDKVIVLLDKEADVTNSDEFLSKLVGMGIYNFTSDGTALMYLYNNPNTYRDVAHYQQLSGEKIPEVSESVSNGVEKRQRKVLGIKNVTSHAGATTFCYLLKKILSEYYSTMVVEVEKRDFVFLKDNTAQSIKDGELENVINKFDKIEVFIVDLNNSTKYDLCTDILYLIEPSTIKLNKLAVVDPASFKELKDQKVVINKIVLDDIDTANFEVESNLRVFYNIGPINDKEDVKDVFLPLLKKIGYVVDHTESSTKHALFSIFKKKN